MSTLTITRTGKGSSVLGMLRQANPPSCSHRADLDGVDDMGGWL